MNSAQPKKGGAAWSCQRCGAVADGRPHRCKGLRLCESCYVDTWRPHHRKPHWRYLKSIKNDYLHKRSHG